MSTPLKIHVPRRVYDSAGVPRGLLLPKISDELAVEIKAEMEKKGGRRRGDQEGNRNL